MSDVPGELLARARDLRFAYRRHPVIAGIDLAIRAGRLIGLLGPNGSGKTTLLRLLDGTLTPDTGVVELDGRPLAERRRAEIARTIASVPQQTSFAFSYTALEVVLMGRYPHLPRFALEGSADLAIAADAMRATDTLQFWDRPFTSLSGGEQQRVIIASALAQRPRLLLLDEPTASLDLRYQLEIFNLLRDLDRREHLAMVVATHDLSLAAAYCDEVYLLERGRIVAAGAPADVLTPARLAAVYHIHADVHTHAGSGRLTIVPLGRA